MTDDEALKVYEEYDAGLYGKMKEAQGFPILSGKAYLESMDVSLSNFEYREVRKDRNGSSHSVLHIRFTQPSTGKFFEDDLLFGAKMTPTDIEALTGNTIVDFSGFWETYDKVHVNVKTWDIIREPCVAEFPIVLGLFLSDGSVLWPSGKVQMTQHEKEEESLSSDDSSAWPDDNVDWFDVFYGPFEEEFGGDDIDYCNID